MVTLNCLDNYHQSLCQLIDHLVQRVCSGLAESNNRLARISADTPSVATLPIVNNAQDLDTEYLDNSFWFNELWQKGSKHSQHLRYAVT